MQVNSYSSTKHIVKSDSMFNVKVISENFLCLLMVIVLGMTSESAMVSDYCSKNSTVSIVNNRGERLQAYNLSFDSFQAALDLVKTLNSGIADEVLTICLPQGHHWISNQTNFGNVSLKIVGTGNVSVECNYLAGTFSEEGDHYTWYLNQSNSLHLENIHITNCPFPLRTIAVRNVTVKDCKFT